MEGTEINLELGDTALEGLNCNSENIKIATHLQYVENVLRAAKMEENNKERQQNIANLHRYWTAGIFPIGEHYHKDARKPNFCDSRGNLCAVGYLIQQSHYGGNELVELVTQLHQFSYIKDMHLTELCTWQERSGLSIAELAMIQPTYEFLYINRARYVLLQLEEILKAAPNSEEEQSCYAVTSRRFVQISNLQERAPGLKSRAEDFKTELDLWEQEHAGKKQIVDELLAKLREQVDCWINFGDKHA